MTDDRDQPPLSGAARDELQGRLRSLSRRLRREKLALERLNPLEEPDRYATRFAEVVDLEAQRRELRAHLDPE